MYIKITNGQIEKYPYSIANLRKDNPNVSFPKSPSETLLAEWGVYPVAHVSQPDINHYTQNVKEADPVYENEWKQAWIVEQVSPEEVTNRLNQRIEQFKNEIKEQTKNRLDEFAKTRGYDSILSLCSYEQDDNPLFSAEGKYGRTVRSQTWIKVYEIIDEVEKGTRSIFNEYTDIESELPILDWSDLEM